MSRGKHGPRIVGKGTPPKTESSTLRPEPGKAEHEPKKANGKPEKAKLKDPPIKEEEEDDDDEESEPEKAKHKKKRKKGKEKQQGMERVRILRKALAMKGLIKGLGMAQNQWLRKQQPEPVEGYLSLLRG